ncbi:hypothetical protein IQ251_13170 [Saccharopolyspora sp. HNM0983]|uniref:PLL-like beta propeller domain-containing protein n=1 Tax=Saccharopolyspora montiporae TaxID=2781240 RepID=A0A929G124_9PSEU|nr:hypothetical protein [Saccharopolyspora sp. HNM0983]MBE9375397.1 hypothetical protein [Saccharopolyspora sp. HNM0983]
MANEIHNTGDGNRFVQADTVYGGINDYRQVHTRGRRPSSGKRLAMAWVCTIGLLTSSAVAFDQTAWMFLPGAGAEERCLLPSAPVRSDKDAYLTNFARSVSGTVLQNNQTQYGSDRSGWVDIGGRAEAQPVAACDARGRTAVLTTGGGALQINPDVGARVKGESVGPPDRVQGVRDQWRSLGGLSLVGEPTAARDAEGRLVVVVRDSGGSLWETHQHLPGMDHWSELTELPGDPVRDDPVLRADGNGDLHSFALTAHRTVRVDARTDGGRWRPDRIPPPADDGAVLATTPSVIEGGDGCFQLLSATDRGAIAVNSETRCNSGSTAWQGWGIWDRSPRQEPFVAESPIMTKDANGTRVAYVLDEAGSVYETVYLASKNSSPNERWGSWITRSNAPGDGNPPYVTDLLGATLDAGGQLVVHAVDWDGRVMHTHQKGRPENGSARWSSWTQTSGATGLLQVP